MKYNQPLSIAFGVFMLLPGVLHFVTPEFFNPFIPEPLPPLMVNYIAGVVEIALGLGLIFQAYRKKAAIAVGILMCLFLPIHIRDVIVENPAIGSHLAAYIRLPLQFVLIYWAWFIWTTTEEK